MSKNKNKTKYYAIKDGKGVKDIILMSWTECEKLVKGYPAIYKSFRTEDEAKEYLGQIKQIDIEEIREKNNKAMEYNKTKKKTTTHIKGFRIKNELYQAFTDKCIKMEMTQDKALELLIKEWIY